MIKNTVVENPDQLFRQGLAHLRISPAEESVRHLFIYAGELQKWNRHINLIARKASVQEIVEKHFLDSLTLMPFLQGVCPPRGILLDVGTGAGFPGLVLAAALPELQVVLIEPRSKRISFLRHIVRLLLLENVEIIESRFEDVPKLYEKNIVCVTSRAVVDPMAFLSMVEGLLDTGASALLMLSPAQKKRLQEGGFSDPLIMEKCRDFVLPFTRAKRTVCKVIKKISREV